MRVGLSSSVHHHRRRHREYCTKYASHSASTVALGKQLRFELHIAARRVAQFTKRSLYLATAAKIKQTCTVRLEKFYGSSVRSFLILFAVINSYRFISRPLLTTTHPWLFCPGCVLTMNKKKTDTAQSLAAHVSA
jgi:hypothetical protein